MRLVHGNSDRVFRGARLESTLKQEEPMDFVSLNEMVLEAENKKKRKIDLFGTDNFRSWMLYFVPGDGTDMHYHASPETFLVLAGTGVVKGIKGEERPIQKDDVVFFAAKDYYQITNTGTKPLVLFGNRSEAFGGPHIKADGTDRNARQ
jgi:mannose-6-phosphate isomerase-like protein (cupin superfamily)